MVFISHQCTPIILARLDIFLRPHSVEPPSKRLRNQLPGNKSGRLLPVGRTQFKSDQASKHQQIRNSREMAYVGMNTRCALRLVSERPRYYRGSNADH
jgi:hypothetical protein